MINLFVKSKKSSFKMQPVQKKINSQVGPMYLVASANGLQGVFWKEQNISFEEVEASSPQGQLLQKAEKQLIEYLEGKRKFFDLPLDPQGTEFQKKVWQKLCDIPYGGTKSYKDIALELQNANACRAVGMANGKNPLSIIVPCHRVIASNGTLCGYAGGLEVKKKLLAIEERSMPNSSLLAKD